MEQNYEAKRVGGGGAGARYHSPRSYLIEVGQKVKRIAEN